MPLGIIWRYEAVSQGGKTYKFRTKPVDPVDVFRGRYVSLNFADERVPLPESGKENFYYREGVFYVKLKTDAEGFAVPEQLSETPFKDGDFVIATRVRLDYSDVNTPGQRQVVVSYPFNRFYLPEDVAPKAERLYWKNSVRRTDTNSAEIKNNWLEVKVLNGLAVPSELYIGGKPVREVVREVALKATERTSSRKKMSRCCTPSGINDLPSVLTPG